VPLVIMLHGGGGNADNAESMSASRPRPIARGSSSPIPTGRGGAPMFTGTLGTAAVTRCRTRWTTSGSLARSRPGATRSSHRPRPDLRHRDVERGMMSHRGGRAGRSRGGDCAGVGAVFGDEASPRAPVSAIIINGMRDESVPYEGGKSGGLGARAWDGTPTRPAVEQGSFWASAGRCNPTPRESDGGGYTLWQYDCPSPVGVARYAIPEGGHTARRVPQLAARRSGHALDATDVIWDFFGRTRSGRSGGGWGQNGGDGAAGVGARGCGECVSARSRVERSGTRVRLASSPPVSRPSPHARARSALLFFLLAEVAPGASAQSPGRGRRVRPPISAPSGRPRCRAASPTSRCTKPARSTTWGRPRRCVEDHQQRRDVHAVVPGPGTHRHR
jgi:polyhydroxybutyrate depolymerase